MASTGTNPLDRVNAETEFSSELSESKPNSNPLSNPRGRDDIEAGQMDVAKIEAAVRMILEAVGEDPDREGLVDTPARVARMYQEIFGGLHKDERAELSARFHVEHGEMVFVRDLSLIHI